MSITPVRRRRRTVAARRPRPPPQRPRTPDRRRSHRPQPRRPQPRRAPRRRYRARRTGSRRTRPSCARILADWVAIEPAGSSRRTSPSGAHPQPADGPLPGTARRASALSAPATMPPPASAARATERITSQNLPSRVTPCADLAYPARPFWRLGSTLIHARCTPPPRRVGPTVRADPPPSCCPRPRVAGDQRHGNCQSDGDDVIVLGDGPAIATSSHASRRGTHHRTGRNAAPPR